MNTIRIAGRSIGASAPVFIVAEMSANHDQDLAQALALVDVAADAGVDALKLQTYTPASLTLPTAHPSAQVEAIWGAATLFELYQKAAMPYEFHQPLIERARARGLVVFSTPFDFDGVDYLEKFDLPAYKVASSELVHLPLLRHIAQTGKPVILSTGMADMAEVAEALNVLASAGADQIALLHCCATYPADPASVNLAAMQNMRQAFGHPVGFSDHTLGCAVPIAAAALGACIIEKHFTNDPGRPGPDHRYSIDPRGLRQMVDGIRKVELAVGDGRKIMAGDEAASRAVGRRSVFSTVEIPAGTTITGDMLTIVRPGSGLHPRYFELLVGRVARRDIPASWPVSWDDI